MSRPDGAHDELGLAEVAWRLRTTLASAGDLSAPGDDAVLSGIRRRSQKRRRAKRVLSTSMASFVLIFATLLVIKGGQVAINHDVARQAESPAVTPGPESAGTTVPGGPSTTSKPDDNSNVVVGECPSGDKRTCRSTTAPSTGPTTVPGTTVPGDPTPSSSPTTRGSIMPGPTGQAVTPNTGTQATPPATTLPPAVSYTLCPELSQDPDCLVRARGTSESRRLVVETPDPANPGMTITRMYSVSPAYSWIWVETHSSTGTVLQQCTELSRAAPPDYIAVGHCTDVLTPVTR